MFWTYFDDPDQLVAGLTPNMAALMQSRGMNDNLVLRSRISMSNNDLESAEKFVSYLQSDRSKPAVFEVLVEWMRRARLEHLIRSDAPCRSNQGQFWPSFKKYSWLRLTASENVAAAEGSGTQNGTVSIYLHFTVTKAQIARNAELFYQYFDDPDGLVNALAFRMTELLESKSTHDRLILRARLSMANIDVESSQQFVSYLRSGAAGEDVFMAAAEWMRSDAGDLGDWVKADAPGGYIHLSIYCRC